MPKLALKKFILPAILASALFLPLIIQNAYAQNCMELGTCDLSDQPFALFLQPFLLTIGDMIYIIVWGLIVFILYMRSENPMLPGVVGLVLAASFTSAAFAAEFVVYQRAIQLGLILFAIAMAFMLFTIFKSKLQNN